MLCPPSSSSEGRLLMLPQKTVLEMAITRMLSDTTIAGARGQWLKYDENAGTISTTSETQTALMAAVSSYPCSQPDISFDHHERASNSTTCLRDNLCLGFS